MSDSIVLSAGQTSVNQVFSIDMREVRRAVYYKFGRPSVLRLNTELAAAFTRGGNIARHEANLHITGGEDSKLAKAAKVKTKVSGTNIETVVDWDDAVSDTGFRYAAAVDSGRKEVVPVNKTVLRWEHAGEEIFSKRSKAFEGLHFTKKGLSAARPKIMGEIYAGIHRWAAG